MEQGIKFVITGDTKGLDKAAKDSEKSISDVNKEISLLKQNILDNNGIVRNYRKAISDLSNEYKKGNITQRQYDTQLDKLKNDLLETQLETDRFRKEIIDLNVAQKRLRPSLNNAGKSLESFGRRGGSATSAVTSFSQVIQDAPYGIRGVANNIEQLSTQLIYLSRSSGGARGALSAFLGALTGPAGILLAISAVTGAMVAMSNSGTRLSDVLDKLGISVSNLTKEQRAYIESLYSATAAVQSEISTLNALLAIARNTNTIYNVRARALQEINDKYGDLLGNLDLEGLKTKRVTAAVNTLTRALIKQAQVKALQAAIDERAEDAGEDFVSLALRQREAYNNVSGEVENLRKNIATFNQFVDKDAPLEDQLRQIEELTKGANNQSTSLLRSYINSYNAATKKVSDFRKETEASIAPLQDILRQTLGEQFFSEITSDTFDMEEIILSPEKEKNIKDRFKNLFKDLDKDIELIDANKATENAREVNEIFKKIGFDFEAVTIPPVNFEGEAAFLEIQAIEKILNDLKGKVTAELFIDLQGMNLEQLTAFQAQFKRLGDEAKIMSDVVGAGFNAMTQQIVNSLNTNSEVVNAMVAAIVGALSEMLSAYIATSIAKKALAVEELAVDSAVATGNAIVAGSETAAASGPAAAFLLPALVGAAIGFIAASFAGIKFAQGGIVPGGMFTGDNVPAFLNSGERVLTAQDQSALSHFLRGNNTGTQNTTSMEEIEWRLKGTDIVGSIKRTLNSNNRRGGNISL